MSIERDRQTDRHRPGRWTNGIMDNIGVLQHNDMCEKCTLVKLGRGYREQKTQKEKKKREGQHGIGNWL